MIIWGINAMNHDASISVVDSDTREILFAGHAERYSRVKNDTHLNMGLINDARHEGGEPDLIVWFENPWGRKLRYLKSGQRDLLWEQSPKAYLKTFKINAPIKYSDHHASHAAGSYFTSGFNNAAILVIDAIGELTTASIWEGKGNKLKKKWSLKYPNSIGLFYSAITDLCGLKPNEEEYILMGMAAYGNEEQATLIAEYIAGEYFTGHNEILQGYNFHQGIKHDDILNLCIQTEQGRFDIAAAAQRITTNLIQKLVDKAGDLIPSGNLVYSGGVSLNCVANTEVMTNSMFNKMWIMPNPGDAGNSLGAIANYLRKPLKWKGPFLGHHIHRPLDIEGIINELSTTGICGVANGRAEFGPRAFGNRSLLADPRRPDIKDKVNAIKKRQEFRPFAPAVLARFADDCFVFPQYITDAKYMQYIIEVREPEKYPAISHVDNSARVQTVDEEAVTMNKILEAWYARTGCPMLLNTSLNIKGEPLVDSWLDAKRWQGLYHVKVF